jgi:hypothetical protein
MKNRLILALLISFFFAGNLYAQPFLRPGSEPKKSQAYVISPGVFILADPSSETYFSLQTESEYNVFGFFNINLGGGFAVNGDYFSFDLDFGFLGKFDIAGPVMPTFKADFLFRDFYAFESKTDTSRYAIGGSFGPGVRYYFPNGNAVLFEALLEIGKFLKEPKTRYIAIVPSMGFEF